MATAKEMPDSVASLLDRMFVLWLKSEIRQAINDTSSNLSELEETVSAFEASLEDKANKVSGAHAGNFPKLDSDGDLVDSGKEPPTGSVVGTTDAQALTNKTINADDNTISNLEHGSEVNSPASNVHGVTGNVVGTSDTQTLTNKTITAADNTITIGLSDLNGVSGAAAVADDGPADASAVSSISCPTGSDAIDRASFNTSLGTLVTEINAIRSAVNTLKSAHNDIIDNLQAAGLMGA